MRSLRKIAIVVMLAAAAWFAGAIAARDLSAQGSNPPPSSPTAVATSNSPAQPRTEMGVWHHFGEGSNKATPAPSQSGTWHHFGETNNLPPQPHGSSNWRITGLSRVQEMEQQMFEMVNRDRADPANTPETGGRAFPLQWNEQLAAVARAHSLDMLRQGYFDHRDPQGRNVAGRVESAGMEWQALGENIAISGSVANAQAAFMNEPRFAQNHRGNILSKVFIEVGIGIVAGPDGRLYITQDFRTPRSHP